VLTPELARRFARVALANIDRDYPRHALQLLTGPEQERSERALHPAFYGSYDWHSAVHMHWTLMRVLRLYPASSEAILISDALDVHLTEANIARELDYFRSPAGRTFERPYGWAWLLELQAEALTLNSRWSRALQPLAEELAQRFAEYLRMSPYPVRSGAHGNSAFACRLALDYALAAKDAALESEVRKAARRWYEGDRAAPIAYEPSLDDFLSPALMEAALMRQLMDDSQFTAWMRRFAPDGLGALAEPPTVIDHADPKQSHLDGLCLSRAWCFARLGDMQAAQALLAAALPYATGGDYAGRHWLASFAALALGERP
jgi:hypothetical protein